MGEVNHSGGGLVSPVAAQYFLTEATDTPLSVICLGGESNSHEIDSDFITCFTELQQLGRIFLVALSSKE